MERPFQLLKDIHHRKELWKLAVKVKDKWKVVKDGKQSFEPVVYDAKVIFSLIVHFQLIVEDA
jgi:hypothetical protein